MYSFFCADCHGSNNKLVIGCPGSSIWHGVVNLENCSDTLLARIETKYGMRNFKYFKPNAPFSVKKYLVARLALMLEIRSLKIF
jgi:hypothetical protein